MIKLSILQKSLVVKSIILIGVTTLRKLGMSQLNMPQESGYFGSKSKPKAKLELVLGPNGLQVSSLGSEGRKNEGVALP